MYKVIISNKVVKEIDNLPDNNFLRIDEVIQALKENARLVGSIKLTDIEGYRIKIGDYRILYTINENLKEIHIFKVIHRKDAYKRK